MAEDNQKALEKEMKAAEAKKSADAKSKKKEKKPKSTVRNRNKQNSKAAAQRFVPIAEIRNDTVLLKNGGMRAVLEVEALNFNLKSETEQKGIIAGYQAFINSLNFPIQIVVNSRRVNIDPYIKDIRSMAKNQQNPLLKKQTESYAQFVEKVVEVADIMTKKFYVIVPLDDEEQGRGQPQALKQFFSWMQIDDSESKAVQRYKSFMGKHTKLMDRINLVQSGLNSIGLLSHRVKTRDLIELYYKTYNPKISADQKLNKNLNTDNLVL